VSEFASVEDFWKVWNFAPKPSEVFHDGNSKPSVDGKSIVSLSLCKKGVRPDSLLNAGTSGSLVFTKPMQVPSPFAHWMCRPSRMT
jgi:hypothetical protein